MLGHHRRECYRPQTRTAVIEHEVNDVVRLLPPKIVCAKDPNGGPECAQ